MEKLHDTNSATRLVNITHLEDPLRCHRTFFYCRVRLSNLCLRTLLLIDTLIFYAACPPASGGPCGEKECDLTSSSAPITSSFLALALTVQFLQ